MCYTRASCGGEIMTVIDLVNYLLPENSAPPILFTQSSRLILWRWPCRPDVHALHSTFFFFLDRGFEVGFHVAQASHHFAILLRVTLNF